MTEMQKEICGCYSWGSRCKSINWQVILSMFCTLELKSSYIFQAWRELIQDIRSEIFWSFWRNMSQTCCHMTMQLIFTAAFQSPEGYAASDTSTVALVKNNIQTWNATLVITNTKVSQNLSTPQHHAVLKYILP